MMISVQISLCVWTMALQIAAVDQTIQLPVAIRHSSTKDPFEHRTAIDLRLP